jgi:hypothetical protein
MFMIEHWELMPDQRSPATTNTQIPPEHPNNGNPSLSPHGLPPPPAESILDDSSKED